MENVAAITFDVGGTLIEPWPSVGHAYAEVAARHGVHVAPEEITQRFVEAWRQRGEFDPVDCALQLRQHPPLPRRCVLEPSVPCVVREQAGLMDLAATRRR